MRYRADLTADIVRELVHYDPKTGLFVWKWRDRKWYASEGAWKQSNKRRPAGTPAFTTTIEGGYLSAMFFGTQVLAHRVAFLWMEGRWPTEIDHINRSPPDNRWCNLREVTRSQNRLNVGPPSNNTSGALGVYRRKDGVYSVHIAGVYVGRFKTRQAAIAARQQAEQECWEGREVTRHHAQIRANNKTGVNGVCIRENGTYLAAISNKRLGTFKTLAAAAAARRQAEQDRDTGRRITTAQPRAPSSTGVPGVYRTRSGHYAAARPGGEYLGFFKTFKAAVAARWQAERQP